MTSHDYRVFGLTVRSELELPELSGGERSDAPDVCINLGKAGGAVDAAPGIHADGDALVLIVTDIARFRIAGGSSIVVEPVPGVPERNVRLFLLGSAFGALLHQRGLLPLHANAVEINGKAVAFMGHSGAGKSTLAAWFHDHGFRVLADDVCVVSLDDEGRAMARTGLPRLRLWAEALDASGRASADYSRSYIGNAPQDKFDVPVEPYAWTRDELELGPLYVLEAGPDVSIEPVRGVDAVQLLFANTYRGKYVALTGTARLHYDACVRLARRCPLFRARRAWDLGRFDEQAEQFLSHAIGAIDQAKSDAGAISHQMR